LEPIEANCAWWLLAHTSHSPLRSILRDKQKIAASTWMPELLAIHKSAGIAKFRFQA